MSTVLLFGIPVDSKIARGEALRFALLLGTLALCSCGGSPSSSSQSNTSSNTPPNQGYIALSETAFIGDEIVMSWPEMNNGGSFGVFGISDGTIESISEAYPPDMCPNGCSPSGFQLLVNGGMGRAVFLMGTFDVLNSGPCGGNVAYGAWDGIAGDPGDPTQNYAKEDRGLQVLWPKDSVFVGTLPPLGRGTNGGTISASCAAVVNVLNAEIKTMAAQNNIPLVDFGAAMQTSDITMTGPVTQVGIVPNATGYAIMTQLYGTTNQ